MNGPPPAEVWRVFQGAFKELHTQLIESKLKEAQMLAQASEVNSSGYDNKSKAAFAPQALGSPGGGAGNGLGSFKSPIQRK